MLDTSIWLHNIVKNFVEAVDDYAALIISENVVFLLEQVQMQPASKQQFQHANSNTAYCVKITILSMYISAVVSDIKKICSDISLKRTQIAEKD